MPDSLEVTVNQEGEIGILETDGYINNIGAEKIAEACDGLIQEGIKSFVLNLENSRIINSIGISILIEVIEKVKDLEGEVAFCCVTPTVAKTFKIMGLLKASSIYDNQTQAVEAISSA